MRGSVRRRIGKVVFGGKHRECEGRQGSEKERGEERDGG